jgi:two-component system, chemotaxis family, CheB/CheR fusion protein
MAGTSKSPKKSAGNEVPASVPAPGEGRPSLAFPVVGVGASAGGVEAFSELLRNLPADAGMALVLIQHLSPKHKTILPEILARTTSMPVLLAEESMEVRPDHVYVIPPGDDMTIFHGRLSLVKRSDTAGVHLPIDHFLRSLAVDQQSRAVGVVLSGSASDGALGLAAVKAEGGITFAQEPSSARYESMPSSAIAADAVDVVLDPAGIAAELARLGRHPYLTGDQKPALRRPVATDDQPDRLQRIFVILRAAYGVDFSAYRRSTVERRINRRMALYRMDSIAEYEDYLRTHPAEVGDLYHDILIMVTEFFREPETFRVLTEVVLPRIVEHKRTDDQIRVWVPGCATGEEPYSIALALQHVLRQADRILSVKIFGTDISERAIAQARAGVYAESKLQAVPREYRQFFTEANGGYQISKVIRDMVVFARHDVTADAPFSQLDLVSCRNLLIYLSPAAQDRVRPVFHYALRPQGYLVLGPSESIGGSSDLFAPVDKKNKIFVKKSVPHRVPLDFSFIPTAGRSLPGDPRDVRLFAERRFDPQHAADELLLTQYAPPSVIIDDAFEIMQFRGATGDYLKHSSGRATLNLLDMAREGLAADIRRAVDDARASAARVRQDIRYKLDDEMRRITLEVVPISGPARERYFLVLFGLRQPPDSPPDGDGGEASTDELSLLRRELDASREYMQATVRDKEAALEELRAANEEVQSSNEELQSINEELETAKEELQSTNEELRTVNEELEHRNTQLSRSNDDLNNLLRAVSMPTIMVGRDLRLRRFTPGTERVMNLIAGDVGRPITDIAPRLHVPDLGELLSHVIEDIVVEEREVHDEHGHWYAMRVRPYQTEENRIDGAVITLLDVNELRTALRRMAQVTGFGAAVDRILVALQGDEDESHIVRVILAEAAAALEADTAAVLRPDGGDWVVRFAQAPLDALEGDRLTAEQLPQAEMAVASRGAVTLRAPGGLELLGMTTRALVAAPLLRHGAAAGSLVFLWQDASHVDEDAEDFAGKAAALVALTLPADA